jgi:acyl carrier protein
LNLAHIIQTMLGTTDTLHHDQQLMDAGMNSMMAVQLRQDLSKHLCLPLPSTLAFDYPTIRAITAFIASFSAQAPHSDHPDDAGSEMRTISAADTSTSTYSTGLACRYPIGSSTLHSIHEDLKNGSFGVRKVPFTRWDT